jgi:hypothetical protein
MDRILSTASFAYNRRRKQKQRRPMLAVQELDLGEIPLNSVHAAGPNGKTIETATFV